MEDQTEARAQRSANRRCRKLRRKNASAKFMAECESEITEGNAVRAMPDEELFEIEREPLPTLKKFTRRQQAALDKISRDAVYDVEKPGLPAPKAPKIAQTSLKPRAAQKQPVKKTQPKADFDIWATDLTPKVNLPIKEAAEHFLTFTKQKQPSVPSSTRVKSSLLKPVALPAAGASYNPNAEDYEKYLIDAAGKVKDLEYEGNGPKVKSALPNVTYEEMNMELTEGLPIDPRYNDDEMKAEDVKEENEDEAEDVCVAGPIEVKRKTRKQRETAKRVKLEERLRLQKKESEKHQHDVYRAKQMVKKLAKLQAEQEANAGGKRQQKYLKKMTTRHRLGKGLFEEEEDPVLLPEELSGSLRQLKPQGSVLTDRIKSMQKRNMLPIGGEREKRLKKKLKRKFVEKRSAKEVKKGSRII